MCCYCYTLIVMGASYSYKNLFQCMAHAVIVPFYLIVGLTLLIWVNAFGIINGKNYDKDSWKASWSFLDSFCYHYPDPYLDLGSWNKDSLIYVKGPLCNSWGEMCYTDPYSKNMNDISVHIFKNLSIIIILKAKRA